MTKPKLILSSENLKHFSYSPFWGLVYKDALSDDNLYTEIQSFNTRPDLVATLINQQIAIDNSYPFIRFFYYLFNINDYARNAYRLAAFEAVQPSAQANTPLYQSGDEPIAYSARWAINKFLKLFSEYQIEIHPILSASANDSRSSIAHDSNVSSLPKQSSSASMQAILVPPTDTQSSENTKENHSGTSSLSKRSSTVSLQDVQDDSQPPEVPATSQYREASPESVSLTHTPSPSPARINLNIDEDHSRDIFHEEDNDIKITNKEMLEKLKILGITNKEIGDIIQYNAIEKAFRAQALKWHPDKNSSQDSDRMFCQLQEAYEYFAAPSRSVSRSMENPITEITRTAEHDIALCQSQIDSLFQEIPEDKSEDQIREELLSIGFAEEDIQMFLDTHRENRLHQEKGAPRL